MYSTEPMQSSASLSPITLILNILLLIFIIVCQVRIFIKAGLHGWETIIPFYNIYCQFKIVGLKGYMMLLLLIPIVNLLLLLYVNYRIYRCFGASVPVAILFLFFSFIGQPVIAFSKHFQYEGVV